MTKKDPKQPDMFSDEEMYDWPHARHDAPSTSHEAVPEPKKLAAQALRVLRTYHLHNRPMIDHDAYRLSGLSMALNGARMRCSDLRKAGFIELTGGRGEAPSGKPANLCEITPMGRAYVLSRLEK